MKTTDHDKEFKAVSTELIEELQCYADDYTPSQLKRLHELEELAKTDRKAFVKSYMRLSGATQWDLPDVIFKEM